MPNTTHQPYSADPRAIFPVANNTAAVPPSAKWGNIQAPYPTNWWATNLAVEFVSSDPKAAPPPRVVVPFPYSVEVSEKTNAVAYNYPKPLLVENKEGKKTAQIEPFVPNISLGAAELKQPANYTVTAKTDLSATVSWQLSAEQSFHAPIVRGCPYATGVYENMTPRFNTVHAILKVNGQEKSQGTLTNKTFTVEFNNGQVWKIYAQEPLTLSWGADAQLQGWSMIANQPYNGWLRAALLTDPQNSVHNSEALLDQYAETVVTGGKVTQHFNDNKIIETFKWDTLNQQQPLMVALPHHQANLQNTLVSKDELSFSHIKGPMLGVVGDWQIQRPLREIDLVENWHIDQFSAEQQAAIAAALEHDQHLELPAADADMGPYTWGKMLARLARLAGIAQKSGRTDIANNIVKRLQDNLSLWVEGKVKDRLCYDQTWGGIVPKNGLQDSGADFGSGIYNDHHFHYGYFLYTAAVINSIDPAWLQQPLGSSGAKYQHYFDALAKDIANPEQDAFFPYSRLADSYDGHSWASGVVRFGDGKNQESTSEAVNAWYAAYHYAHQTGNTGLKLHAAGLLDNEIRAAQYYWQLSQEHQIYLPELVQGKVVIPIIWSNKADDNTWFDDPNNPPVEKFHVGIEMLPFTPATIELLAESWARQSFEHIFNLLQQMQDNDPWKAIILKGAARGATGDKQALLWKMAENLQTFDEGDSRTNTLFTTAGYIFQPKPQPSTKPQPSPKPSISMPHPKPSASMPKPKPSASLPHPQPTTAPKPHKTSVPSNAAQHRGFLFSALKGAADMTAGLLTWMTLRKPVSVMPEILPESLEAVVQNHEVPAAQVTAEFPPITDYLNAEAAATVALGIVKNADTLVSAARLAGGIYSDLKARLDKKSQQERCNFNAINIDAEKQFEKDQEQYADHPYGNLYFQLIKESDITTVQDIQEGLDRLTVDELQMLAELADLEDNEINEKLSDLPPHMIDQLCVLAIEAQDFGIMYQVPGFEAAAHCQAMQRSMLWRETAPADGGNPSLRQGSVSIFAKNSEPASQAINPNAAPQIICGI